MLPLDFDLHNRRLTLAAADINDLVAIDKVRSQLPDDVEVETLLAGESEIDRAIDQYYGYELSIDGILHEIETGEIDFRSLQASADEYSQPVVRLIDSILTDAVKRDASDVHFEPEANFLRIRYRIDGMLRQIRALHKSYWPAMTVRIKVLSGMNIAESRAYFDALYTVVEATDGAEALTMAMVSSTSIHLLITDVVMPEMGGKLLADQLAEHIPGLKVLFMSGDTDMAMLHHGKLNEGMDFLQKPFTPQSLARKVRDVLDATMS